MRSAPRMQPTFRQELLKNTISYEVVGVGTPILTSFILAPLVLLRAVRRRLLLHNQKVRILP
jgi:hypothetical protein